MRIEFIASFATVTPDLSASRALYVEALGLPLEHAVGDDYLHSEAIDGSKHFGVWPLTQAAQACFGTSQWPDDVPVPQASIYAVHVQVKEHLAQFTSLEQDINLPAEYLNAIHWNLCVRLFPQYQRQADPLIVSLAKDSLNTLRKANVQIGRLTMPTDLVRPGIYNPYSDQIR